MPLTLPRIAVPIMILIIAAGPAVATTPPSRADFFATIHRIVAEDFHDPDLCGVDWHSIGVRFGPLAARAPTRDAFARIVNTMLKELNTSHTWYLTPDDPKYYQLLGVFESSGAYKDELDKVRRSLPQRKIGYVGIGIETLQTDAGLFVSAVFDGGPAAQGGLLVGDRLITVEGEAFHPIRSFQSRCAKEVAVVVQRTRGGPTEVLKLTPRLLEGARMFREAMEESVRVVRVGDRKIGYIHAWSYSGQQYQDLLVETLFGGELAGVDALLFDLRDGWGGASPDYLHIFDRRMPKLLMTRRGHPPMALDRHWRKPVALLVDQRVRSGKEAFVHGFKRLGLGPVIGETTAGAVMAGALRFLPDHSVLYVAVGDIAVDGQRLEGRGVAPSMTVPRPIPFCQGHDPQFEAGIRSLTEAVDARRRVRRAK